jgi:hypothetical protein
MIVKLQRPDLCDARNDPSPAGIKIFRSTSCSDIILSSRIEYQANDDFADELCLCHYTTAKSRCNITYKIGGGLLNRPGDLAGLLAER